MASVDGARSLKSSSEESFQFECSPCENDGVTKEAKYFCPECKDYLCESCETSHKRFKSTRNHKVVTGSMMPASVDELKEADSFSILCLCTRHTAEIYCKFHDEVFCSECKTIKHRLCQSILIDEMAAELDKNSDNSTLQGANDVKDKFTKLQTSRKQDLKKLSAETESCKEDIISFRKEFNQHLDTIEERALNDLYQISDLHKDAIEQHLDACNTALNTLSFDYNNHVTSKDSRNGRQKFLTDFKLRRTLKDINAVLEDLNEEMCEPRLSFDRSKALSDVLDTDSFGVLTHNLRGQPKRFSIDMKVQSSCELNTKMPSDMNLPWISGSCFLPGGDLVLCDRNNDSLKIFDHAFASSKDSIKLSGKPRGCCFSLNSNELLVTVPEKKKIQCFQTFPSIQLKRSIHLEQECEGVASLDQDIFVTCHREPDKEILIVDQDGNLKRRISLNEANKTSFQIPFYIAVASTGNCFVSEASNSDWSSQIRYFTKDGICSYIYSDSRLKGPVGMFVDIECRLLVCYWKSNTVQLLSKDGITSKDFFESTVDIVKPYSISFRESDATLVVTFREKNEILICKMK